MGRARTAIQVTCLLAGATVTAPRGVGASTLNLEVSKATFEGSWDELPCGIPDASALTAGTGTIDGNAAYQRWLAAPEAQSALPKLWELERQFEQQVIGLAIDHINQRMAIVIDPSLHQPARAIMVAAIEELQLPFTVGIVDGCHSKSTATA